ncbi:hypothetical protein KGQ20_19450 [Catenulispora sp. NF23]|nr:hypothetical protein [Catenulispora pinistramenti]MBS2534948.1 hypothetical protein [Catenulispora pinistramenti]
MELNLSITRRTAVTVTGYQASENMTVTLRDTKSAGAAAAVGGSTVNPVPIQVGGTGVTVQVTAVFSFG